MAKPDLVIRGGNIADGLGGELFEADVAITDGRTIVSLPPAQDQRVMVVGGGPRSAPWKLGLCGANTVKGHVIGRNG